jgi:Immunoglobulin I-set domain
MAHLVECSPCLINFISSPIKFPAPWISVVPQLLPFAFEAVNAGDMTAVQCTVVKGDSPIHIVWLFNGTELKSGEGVAVMTSGTRLSSLSIEAVRAENAGEYTCLARNAAGASNHTAYLHVNGISALFTEFHNMRPEFYCFLFSQYPLFPP